MSFVKKKKIPRPFTGASLLIWLLFALSPAGVKAQDMKTILVTVSEQGKTLKEIFKDLEQKTGLSINFQDNTIDASKKMNIDVVNQPLSVVMTQLLAGEQADFAQHGSMIIITPRKEPVTQKQTVTASLKGRIVDYESAQPLPGATVGILETGRSVVTDARGYYELTKVPEGIYTLVISYAGYEKNVLRGIRLTGGHTTTYDVKMAAGKSLDQVVVSSGAHRIKTVSHSTEKELIAEIRNSTGSVSGISNEMINKTADRNAAEVVKKISGVSVVDERFIIVRGMNERYNLTYLNGNVAPSTELNDKAFAYDLIPSSVIDRILVYKSPVSDLVADYAGAAIKVYTKNAMPVRHLDIGIQLAHRPGSTMANINSYNGGKYDFLGFDDGTRKLPSFSPGYFQSNQQVAGIAQQTLVKGFSPVLDYGTAHSLPDMQFFINYYDNFRIGKHIRLYDLTSVTYGHETRFYDVYHQTGNTYAYGFIPDPYGISLGQNNQITNSQQTTEIGKINILENLTLKWNAHNSIILKNFFINEGRVLTTASDAHANVLSVIDSAEYSNSHQHNINLSFQQRLLYFGNLTGEHTFGKDNRHALAWNLGYTFNQQYVPDQRNSIFFSALYPGVIAGEPPALGFLPGGTNVGDLNNGDLGMITRTFTKQNENVYNASVDYLFHLRPDLSLRAGTYQLYKVREVGRRIFRVNRGGLQPGQFLEPPASETVSQGWAEGYGNSNPNTVFFREQYLNTIWNPANFPQDGSGLWIYDVTTVSDSYAASEQNNAGYVSGDWNPVGKALTINAGLRVEYDRQAIAGGTDDGAGSNIVPIKQVHPRTDWLPSANITFRPGSLFVLRTGYGRTMNRPELRELTPYSDLNYQDLELDQGNPYLISSRIDNYDFRAEFYPRSSRQNEMLNAGVFYKKLQNPIERLRASYDASLQPGNFTVITYDNSVSAEVYGVEAEIRKSLSFLPGNFFRNLSFAGNGALIKSSTIQQTLDVSGNLRDTGVNVKGRPLQGQSPYVFNASLFYENPAWGTKIGVTYNVSGARIYAKSVANANSSYQVLPGGPGGRPDSANFTSLRPDLLELPRHLLDISISQRIVKSLVLKFNVQNILQQPFRIVEDHNYNQRYDKEQPVLIHSSSANLQPGVKYYYYKGDNIYNSYNPGPYFLCQLTYAF